MFLLVDLRPLERDGHRFAFWDTDKEGRFRSYNRTWAWNTWSDFEGHFRAQASPNPLTHFQETELERYKAACVHGGAWVFGPPPAEE